MEKKKIKRSTVRLDLRISPWLAFALRAYAKKYNRTLSFAATEAIKCLIYDVPKKTMRRWLTDFRRIYDNEVD